MLGQFRNRSKRGVASFRDSAPDEELVAATKSGDELAFETLVKRHQRRIFALAFRYTRVREDAEDIVQETFRKAFVHLQKFEGKSSFSTWLTRIASTDCVCGDKAPEAGNAKSRRVAGTGRLINPGDSPADGALGRRH